MASCPLKSLPEWVKLVEALGENQAYKVFIANGDRVPSMSDVEDIISNKTKKGEELSLGRNYIQKLAEDQKNYPGEINDTNNRYVWDLENKYNLTRFVTEKGKPVKKNTVYETDDVSRRRRDELIEKIRKEHPEVSVDTHGTKGGSKIDISFPLDNYKYLEAYLSNLSDNLEERKAQWLNALKSPENGLKSNPSEGDQLTLFRSRETLKEKIADENNKTKAEEDLLKGFDPAPKSEQTYKKIMDALEYRLRILQRSGGVRQEMQTNLIASIRSENDSIERMVNVIKQAENVIGGVLEERKTLIEEGQKASPRQLYRWREIVSAFDSLDDYSYYMKLEEGEAAKYTPELRTILSKVIENKNAIKRLYHIEGIEMMVDFLYKNYNRISAEYALEERKAYKKKLRELMKDNNLSKEAAIEKYMSGLTEDEWVNKHISDNKREIDIKTRELIRKELEKASKDIGTLYRYMDNMLDTRDPVASAMVKSFAEVDNRSRIDAIIKGRELLKVVEKLEEFTSMGMYANLEKFYDFMLERDEKGKPTGHIITKFNSAVHEDYREMILAAKDIFEDDEIHLLKLVWKNGYATLSKYNSARYMSLSLGHKMDDDLSKTKPIKERVEFFKKFQEKDAFTPDGNAKINSLEFNLGLNNFYAEMYHRTDPNKLKLTRNEYEELKLNDKRTYENKLSLAQMISQGAIREDVAYEIEEWMYDNTWEKYRTPSEKYRNKQWDKLSKLLEDKNDPRTQFYNAIREIGREADKMIPYKFRLGTRLPGVIKDNAERLIEGQASNPLTFFTRNYLEGFTLRDSDTERGNLEITDADNQPKYFLPIYHTARIDQVDQSYDIPSIYMKYWTMANDHNLKSAILPEMEMAKYFVNEREVVKLKKDGPDGKQVEVKQSKNNLAEQLNDWMKMVVYGKQKAEGKNIEILGKTINLEKTLDAVNTYTAMNLLGLNFISGTANLVLGESLQIMETIAQQYVTLKDYNHGGVFYTKNLPGILGDIGARHPKNVASLLIEEFDILNEYQGIDYRKNTRFRQLMNSNTLFFTSHAGEHFMQSKFFFAMLSNKKAYDSNGKELGSMLDQYESIEGNLKLKDKVDLKKSKWTEKDQEEFRVKMKGVLSRLHGEYSDLGMVAIQQYALGRMAYTFRKFMIPGFKRRWEKYDYNERLGEFTEGNYVTMGKFMKNVYKDLLAFKFDIMGEKWHELSDMEKANIRRTISELIFYFAAIGLTMLLTKFANDDDEDDEVQKQFKAFMLYQVYRFRAELTFFVYPPSAIAILRSPMASLSVLDNLMDVMTQFKHPFDIYERGPNKGNNKLFKEIKDMVPYTRQFYRLRTISNSVSWFKN